MRRLLLLLLLLGTSAAAVEGAFPCDVVTAAPDCWVALRPGPARDVFGLVEVVGETTTESAGELVLTTVAVQSNLTLGELWGLDDDPTSERARRTLYFPEDVDDDVTRQQFAAMMDQSTLAASVAALRQLGYAVASDGIRVRGAVEGGPSDGQFEDGDVIVELDGVPTLDSEALLAELATKEPGDAVTFGVEVEGGVEPRTVTVQENPDDPARRYVGLFIVDRIALPVEVDIDAGTIGGPSAGLMFALTIVDLLDPVDLTGGRVVAGTGTIDLNGRVGPIGGIQQKIPGAQSRDDGAPPAEVFLVPRGNMDEALGASVTSPITLVPIDTLGDAVAALTALRTGERPADAVVLEPLATAAP